MVLSRKKNIIILLSILFFSFSCFCFDFESPQNPFDISSLIIQQNDVYINSQNIDCSENGVEVSYVLRNPINQQVDVPIIIKCIPTGYQTIKNEIPIPLDFKVFINDKNKDFTVNENNNEIFFNITIPSDGKTVVKVSYKNLQNAGVNQTGTNFKYLIKLQKNKNNEPIDYNFVYTSSKNSQAYINNIIIFNNKDNTYPELDYQIKRLFSDNNYWTLNIKNHNFESDNIYIFIGLTYFDLSLDSSDIRIYNYRDTKSIYYKDKNLNHELIESEELFYISNNQLRILRNSFYAIHDYIFNSKDLDLFYSAFKWYKKSTNFSESNFNNFERKNIETIKEMESMKEPMFLSDFK